MKRSPRIRVPGWLHACSQTQPKRRFLRQRQPPRGCRCSNVPDRDRRGPTGPGSGPTPLWKRLDKSPQFRQERVFGRHRYDVEEHGKKVASTSCHHEYAPGGVMVWEPARAQPEDPPGSRAGWRRGQASTNPSLHPNSLIYEEMQGLCGDSGSAGHYPKCVATCWTNSSGAII
jgi:hypothetical protein